MRSRIANIWSVLRKRLRLLLIAGAVLLVVVEVGSFLIIDQSNPAVRAEPNWDSPRTRELAEAACFDCHSNETVWPWYANVAPMSWLLYRDVTEGRDKLNFSEWNNDEDVDDIIEVIDNGDMPPWFYVIPHPSADLSDSEKQELIDGLQATFGQTGEGEQGESETEEGEESEEEEEEGD